ncbi:MAG: RimK family alpha-L-glutamate ligase [Clostridiales bacterium]|nr:RimK family alpha-L-glutamate ligase [Clostridiales bacterium]
MPRGLLVVNAFLRTSKFDELYQILADAAKECGMALDVQTNAELICAMETGEFRKEDYAFVLFWDKDVLLAQRLEQMGVRLFNSARSIALCDDKAMTWLALRETDIPMPRTIPLPKTFSAVGYPSLDFARLGDALGYPVVVKECFGSFGQQVYLCESRAALEQKLRELAGTPLLLQKAVTESLGRDVRINVVGGKVVASILRKSNDGDFRSNLTLGGSMEPYTPTPEEAALAIRATALLGLDFAGVDVLFGNDGPILCEVNSNAHFKTTLSCTGVNMALCIMQYIKEQI